MFFSESVQTYSFVLTSTDSKWRFGFCRHDAKARTAMVIITYLPWHDTFLKFLNVLGELKRTASQDFQPFLAEVYAKGVPEPGACLKLFYNSGLNVSSTSKSIVLPIFFSSYSLTNKIVVAVSFRISCFNGRHSLNCRAFQGITI